MVLRNVTPCTFDAWRSRDPDLVEDPAVRLEYNSHTERMMPHPIHDSLQIFTCQRITESLCGSRPQRYGALWIRNQVHGPFDGDYAFQWQNYRMPTCVLARRLSSEPSWRRLGGRKTYRGWLTTGN